ncbi:MAG TPA: hypothetical protein VFM74_05140, partial [Candidatus Limnocylindria bacterium]|nr:hypothetical protein [Candidatus Limnocylindria bacterium]
ERLLGNRYARLRAIGDYRETEVAPRIAPEPPSLRRRLGRLLGAPRRPRWSEIWPSGGDDTDAPNGTNENQGG